eukprot:GFUD01111777.1.p1 GENE.GFUD01111777.1~~GFUD01111777.1.p1  ORF type:complete len:131 (+),score=37.72 GFUD01111777.1:24-395(+)
MPPSKDVVNQTVVEVIQESIMVISFTIFLILQMVNMSAVLKMFLDMRCKRRVSFSNTVQRKEIPPRVSLYEEQARKDEEATIIEIPQLQDSKSLITLDEEGDKSGSWDSRNKLVFRHGNENFD